MSGARTPRAGSPVVSERSRPCQETLLLIRGAIAKLPRVLRLSLIVGLLVGIALVSVRLCTEAVSQ